MVGPKSLFVLQQKTETRDPRGYVGITWSTVAEVTGVMRSLSSKERVYNDKFAVLYSHRFYCDFNQIPANIDLDESYRFMHKTNTAIVYDVVFIAKKETHYEIDLQRTK